MLGTLITLRAQNGYGLIRSESDGLEYFFHRSACVDLEFDDLVVGLSLRFDATDGDKGPRAERIHAERDRNQSGVSSS